MKAKNCIFILSKERLMRYVTGLLAGLLMTSLLGIQAQEVYIPDESRLGKKTITYALDEVREKYIPPPKGAYHIPKGEGDFIGSYATLPQEAQEAFQFALDIWSASVETDVPVRVSALWQSLDEGVLGSSSATAWYKGSFIGGLVGNAYYTVPMAERIKGEPLNSDFAADISMRFSQNINWYFGTDGNCPTDQYDFVTVALHEIGHGLGFSPSFSASDELGYWGLGAGIPEIWDYFVFNLQDQAILDTTLFPLNSEELYGQLTSNKLYFDGPIARTRFFDLPVKIYAPSPYKRGSSISHLDETFNTSANALMTPFIGKAEVIHAPGPLTLAMLHDMGWIHTRVDFSPPGDTEENLTEITLDINIASDTLLKKHNSFVYFSTDDFTSRDSVEIVPAEAGKGSAYTAVLPIEEYNTTVTYYISVVDTFKREYSLPYDAEKEPYELTVGLDAEPPSGLHIPDKFLLQGQAELPLLSIAQDNLGVQSVEIDYKVNNDPRDLITMNTQDQEFWQGKILLSEESLVAGDSVNYRIVIKDVATNTNTLYLPASGYYTLYVESINNPQEEFATSFQASDDTFITDGFEIDQPANFDSPALHTLHPYESSEEDDTNLEYIALLRTPIQITSEQTEISFREIVLVEPGSFGSDFGDDDFFDYVIVEYSSDYGLSWHPVEEGYDSRTNTNWEILYNNGIVGNNSTYMAKEEDYLSRTMVLTDADGIEVGQEVLLRFRLFSDPYANGWGWAIEDLSISHQTSGIFSPVETGRMRLYPNPVSDKLYFRAEEEKGFGKDADIELINLIGKCVYQGSLSGQTAGQTHELDLSGLSNGMYFLRIRSSEGLWQQKLHILR